MICVIRPRQISGNYGAWREKRNQNEIECVDQEKSLDWIGGATNDALMSGTGKDNLQGDQGNDYLSGDAGDDKLSGGDDQDILAGGIGTDTLWGGAGKDIYIYKKGDGEDTIIDKAADENIIRFGEGIDSQNIIINPGGVTLNFGDGDVLRIELDLPNTDPVSISSSITRDGNGNISTVTVNATNQPDYFTSMGVSAFEFADDTRLTSEELLERGFDKISKFKNKSAENQNQLRRLA